MSDRSKHPENLSGKEKRRSLTTPGQRIQYIWDYYKLPILIACIGIYALGYTVFRHAMRRDTVLYTALINVSVGDQLTDKLSEGFLAGMDNAADGQVRLYTGWYLTDDPSSEQYEYVYATSIKVLASIDDKQLDVVLMDQEAFDAFAQNGYLANLETLLAEEAPELLTAFQPLLTENMEILEDNAQEVALDPSLEYYSVTDSYPMAVILDDAPLIAGAGFSDTVYFGILGNTPRREMAVAYLKYLFADD